MHAIKTTAKLIWTKEVKSGNVWGWTITEELNIISVTGKIVQHLRIHIIEGELTPGQKLNEIELARKLGISRPPLREAFRVMENEHLVVSIPRKGSYVTEVSIEDCREIYQAREMMECFSVDILQAKGIRNLPEVASSLEITADLPMPTSADPYEKFNYLKTIADFHITLVEASGNSRLSHYYHALFPNLARYQSMYTYIPGLMNVSQETHEAILSSIQNGDYDKAKEKLSTHIRGFLALMEKKISKKP